jgi:hypothetical protein
MTQNPFQKISFKAYGVHVDIEFSEPLEKAQLRKLIQIAIPLDLKFFPRERKKQFKFTIKKDTANNLILLKDGKLILKTEEPEPLLQRLESLVRLTIAEFAIGFVFIHAGVVSWKDRAIVIPARSFKGKTTLVVELVKAGATYYSDEYAVVDENGLIYPFPKKLSVRGIIDDYTQLDRDVGFYGGQAGEKPVPGGLILITGYQKFSRFKPELLTQGEGVLELISNTIPIRNNPGFSINVLNKLAGRAKTIRTKRGEAGRFSGKLLKYFEQEIIDKE